MKPDGLELVPLGTRAELRAWLEVNHATSPGMWLVQWRRDDLGPRLPYEDMVEECLCFGWIDSTYRRLDDDRSAIRLTPRRPGGVWARTNKARVARLLENGAIRPAGLAAIDAAKADGSWELLDDVEALIVPPDLAAALARHPGGDATGAFAALTEGRRKQLLWWIKSAKRPATRSARIDRTVSAAADGRSALE